MSKDVKTCVTCGEDKTLDMFGKLSKSPDGLRDTCKCCRKARYQANRDKKLEYQKKYYKENADKIKVYQKRYAEDNQDKISKRRKKHYENNKERICSGAKEWRAKNREAYNASQRKTNARKRREDQMFIAKERIRSLIGVSFRAYGYTKKSKTYQILGIDYDGFKTYIESLFKDGMTWEKRGEWHLDHIIPLASAKNEEELIKLNHYTNLQPLWAEENLKKGANII